MTQWDIVEQVVLKLYPLELGGAENIILAHRCHVRRQRTPYGGCRNGSRVDRRPGSEREQLHSEDVHHVQARALGRALQRAGRCGRVCHCSEQGGGAAARFLYDLQEFE